MAVAADNRVGQVKPARGLMEVLDFATRSHGRAVLVLVVVALLSILPGFFAIPPTDRDESRFAQATKQMIESGDYVDIRFQETTRYKKPVGIYWLQAAVVKTAQALGVRDAVTTIWLYRIPSLLGAVGSVLLTYWAALAFLSRRASVLAALMMATCILLSVEGRIAKTDACLLLTAVAAMGAMARAYLPEQRSQLEGTWSWTVPAIFWTAMAASVLLKGPVIPLIVFLTVVTLVDRRPFHVVGLVAASGRRHRVGGVAGAAVVRGDHPAVRRRILPGVGRTGPAEQAVPGPGIPRRPAWILFSAVLGDVLAGGDAGRRVGAVRVRVAAGAGRQIPARMDRADLDPVRAHRDQAAALCAAAVSRDRNPDRRSSSARGRCRPPAGWSRGRSGGSSCRCCSAWWGSAS